MTLNIVQGDATAPQSKGNKIIAHVCNDLGRWGKGFVLALSKRFASPEKQYRRWSLDRVNVDNVRFALGQTQLVQVQTYIWVANMIAQRGTKRSGSKTLVQYGALEQTLTQVCEHAKALDASVHMPLIGCGLGGGICANFVGVGQSEIALLHV